MFFAETCLSTLQSTRILGFVLIINIPSFHLTFLYWFRISGGSDGKESACNVGDLCLILGFRRSPGGGHGYSLQYSCLENPMDRVWWATVQRVSRSQTWLSTAQCSTAAQEVKRKWEVVKIGKKQEILGSNLFNVVPIETLLLLLLLSRFSRVRLCATP